MPSNWSLPSGTLVEVLCGQPEQKYGVLMTFDLGWAIRASVASSSCSQVVIAAVWWRGPSHWPRTRAMMAGVTSPWEGS